MRLSLGFSRQPYGAAAYVGLQGSDWPVCQLIGPCKPASSSGEAKLTISSSSGEVRWACATPHAPGGSSCFSAVNARLLPLLSTCEVAAEAVEACSLCRLPILSLCLSLPPLVLAQVLPLSERLVHATPPPELPSAAAALLLSPVALRLAQGQCLPSSEALPVRLLSLTPAGIPCPDTSLPFGEASAPLEAAAVSEVDRLCALPALISPAAVWLSGASTEGGSSSGVSSGTPELAGDSSRAGSEASSSTAAELSSGASAGCRAHTRNWSSPPSYS